MVYVSVGHSRILSWTNSHYWLRDHTSWALVEWVKIKSIPKCLQSLFRNSSHQGTLSYSHILKFTKHMLSITNEVDPLFFRCAHAYFHQMVSEWSAILNCITCFVSFGIRDYSFMLLEDYVFNFLHSCWNYVLIKIDIDVMMLFKFEFKYVKLNFKVIASMKFSFDIILWLSCSYVNCLFKKNRRKLP